MSTYLFPKQPLYAFVTLKINSNVISNVDGYLYQDDNGYGNMAYDFREDNSNMVMNLAVNRTVGGSGGEFNISLFDDTAIYAEAIVASVMNKEDAVEIEYGWASGGKKIPDRSCFIKGFFTEYQLSFNGPSITLDITGVGSEIIQLSQSGLESYSAEVYNGSPSEIVKAIADANGWLYDDTTIIETQPVQDLMNSGESMTFIQGGRTIKEFINQDLIANSISLNGDIGYSFWVSDNPDGTKTAYFQPRFSGYGGTYESVIFDDQGGTTSTLNTPMIPDYAEKQAKCVRHYDYYSGTEHSEIISFSPSVSSAGESAQSSNVYSIDAAGEMMGCNIKSLDSNINVDGMKLLGSGSDKSRMMGISTTTYQRLEIASRYLWNFYAEMTWNATLEVMGDPGLQLEDYIEINLYTKYGFKHHTSGIYMINEVEDSIDSGSFVTTLQLTRLVCNSADSGVYNGFGEGTSEAPGGQKVDGGKTGNETLAANNSIVASVTAPNANKYPVPETNDWTLIALSQIGANESDGTYTKYLDYVGLSEGSSWCTAFVSWCLGQAGNTSVTKTGSSKALLDEAMSNGKFKPSVSYIPKAGDIFIQRNNGASHTGFVASVNPLNGTYESVEGNCSGAVKSIVRSLSDTYLTGFYSL